MAAPSRKQIRAERKLTAYHEAGHAVMAWWLGMKILGVEIQENCKGEIFTEKKGHPLFKPLIFASKSTRRRRVQKICMFDLRGCREHP
jgi:hypothetical protein